MIQEASCWHSGEWAEMSSIVNLLLQTSLCFVLHIARAALFEAAGELHEEALQTLENDSEGSWDKGCA